MILVDSAIWIDQLRKPDADLAALLRRQVVVMHPYVLAEVMLGSLHDRRAVRAELADLDPAPLAEDGEVLNLIESAALHGTGIGYVDAHLIASVMLINHGRLWTRDKRLVGVANRLGLAFT